MATDFENSIKLQEYLINNLRKGDRYQGADGRWWMKFDDDNEFIYADTAKGELEIKHVSWLFVHEKDFVESELKRLKIF